MPASLVSCYPERGMFARLLPLLVIERNFREFARLDKEAFRLPKLPQHAGCEEPRPAKF